MGKLFLEGLGGLGGGGRLSALSELIFSSTTHNPLFLYLPPNIYTPFAPPIRAAGGVVRKVTWHRTGGREPPATPTKCPAGLPTSRTSWRFRGEREGEVGNLMEVWGGEGRGGWD